ncbi:MAG: ABC transporter ATP-binding protein [Deltaproteobacteria bacterium]|nr:MAG: ABC transporter ATP-binding protein [Deltaproteobacteria bacterium]
MRLTDVSRTYGEGGSGTRALDGIDLSIEQGAFVLVVGKSGSGKTTLLNVLGGLDVSYEGSVRVDGRELREMNDEELSRFRREKVGFVFQHFYLLDHLNAWQNVCLANMFASSPEPEPRKRACRLLERVGLGGMEQRFPWQLSGGQKQRVAIARALFSRPKLILADEPSGNLDSATGRQIIGLFESLNRDEGLTVIVVTHEGQLFENPTMTVHLEDGRIREAC